MASVNRLLKRPTLQTPRVSTPVKGPGPATRIKISFSHISPRAVQAMISGLFHPDWAFFFETDTSGLGYLLLETVLPDAE